jgi:hypothetical protein
MIPWLLDDYMKKRAANAFNHDIIRRGVPHSGAASGHTASKRLTQG